MYTVSSLKVANPDKNYTICEKDAIKVNALINIFEKNLQNLEPTPGDLIICCGYNNYYNKEVVYSQGIVDEVNEDNKLHICVQPTPPYVLATGRLSTSGGYWFTCRKEEIKRSQELEGKRTFWCWDSYGPRAQGGLYFQASVKIWEITSSKVY